MQFIETHIIDDQSHCASVLIKQLDVEPLESHALPKGLRRLIYDSGGGINRDIPSGSEMGCSRLLSVGALSKSVYKAFLSACQLLVDFSCFPMCCTETPKTPVANNKGQCEAVCS